MKAILAFLKWWIEELTRIVEPFAERRGGAAKFVLVCERGGYRCLRGTRKGVSEAGFMAADGLAASDLARKMKGQDVELRLDAAQVLDKELNLPAAGQQYLDAILRHQIERLTPWAADHVAFDYVVEDTHPAGEGQVAIRLVATARETVESALSPLSALGIRPRRVGTAADALDHPSPVDLQDESKVERHSSLRRAVAVTLSAAAAILLTLGLFQSWQLWVVSSESEEIQAALDARRALIAEAVARTTQSDEYRALAARKQAELPMVVLLEELSRTIPRNTYLTEINVEGPTVRLNGMSEEAPDLIGILEKADKLSNAQFAAPTTRSSRGGADSFQIVVRIAAPEAQAQ